MYNVRSIELIFVTELSALARKKIELDDKYLFNKKNVVWRLGLNLGFRMLIFKTSMPYFLGKLVLYFALRQTKIIFRNKGKKIILTLFIQLRLVWKAKWFGWMLRIFIFFYPHPHTTKKPWDLMRNPLINSVRFDISRMDKANQFSRFCLKMRANNDASY